jgi:large subunit ribosomal protein L19
MKNTVVVSPIDMEARKDMDLRAGDTVRVWQKIEEKGKFRLQAFEGLVLARKHGSEAGGTFTVRRVASGVGVEKIFPLYSPMIDKIEIIKRSRVRRAKLYYIREKVAREARRLLRRTRVVHASPVAAGTSTNTPIVEETLDVNEVATPEVTVE